MTKKEEFLLEWKDLESTVKSYAEKELKISPQLDPTSLMRTYQAQTRKWEAPTYQEYRWLNAIPSEEFRARFLSCMKQIDFQIKAPEAANNSTGLLVGGVGVVAGVALGSGVNILTGILVGIAGLAIGYGLQKNGSRDRKKAQNQAVIGAISEVLNQKRAELEALCNEIE